MSRFNQTHKQMFEPDTTNQEGAPAYRKSPKLALASQLVTSFVNGQFYRSADEELEDLRNEIDRLESEGVDLKFAGQAGIFARQHFGMRSITHALGAEIASRVKGEQWTKYFFNQMVARVDDILETLSYYDAFIGDASNPPAAMRKGFSAALRRFDAYQLDKYRGSRYDWSLVDAVNVLHPKPTEAIDALMNGTLGQAKTWEKEMTKAGQSEEKSKADVWRERIVEDDNLGHFALVRNLRNIAQQADDETFEAALDQLTMENRVQGARMLPFNYMKAARAIADSTVERKRADAIRVAIDDAIDLSLANVPKLDGKTLVVMDESSSMTNQFNSYEGDPVINIASLFTAVLYRAQDADLMSFSNNARYQRPHPRTPVSELAEALRKNTKSNGTNHHTPYKLAAQENKAYDRIVILSDEQGWERHGFSSEPEQVRSSLEKYKSVTGANPHVYSFDLQGHGSMQLPENYNRVYQLAGFSDQVFEVMDALEEDPNAFVNQIEDLDISEEAASQLTDYNERDYS